jgi:serine/threonine-protein kinase
LRLCATVIGVATVAFFVNATATHLFSGRWRDTGVFDGTRLTVLVCTIVAVGFVIVLRREGLSTRTLKALDIAIAWAVVVGGLAYYEVGFSGGPIFLVPVLGLLLLGRAVFVPSTAQRTFWLSLPAAPAVLAIQLAHGELYAQIGLRHTDDAFVTLVTWNQIVLGLSIALATFASYVNFRLRRQVYEATQLGQYALEDRIGEGSMGEVYRAKHALLRRPTAVKVIRGGMLDDRTIARFEEEVRQTARLTHPNTIQVFDYGRTPEGTFYYAMELLDGADLKEIVTRDGPLAPARVIHILAQVCSALEEAHAIGLVHRDIKESNLILCEHGLDSDVVKVMDFGLVKDLRKEDAAISGAGETCGTPETMAPETIRGQTVGPPADVYALGAVGCYLLAGRHVFDAETGLAYIGEHLTGTPTPPSERGVDVPGDLEAILLRCLAKDTEDRPESVGALRDELLACGVAGGWTPDDAKSWWREWRSAVERRRGHPAPQR